MYITEKVSCIHKMHEYWIKYTFGGMSSCQSDVEEAIDLWQMSLSFEFVRVYFRKETIVKTYVH